MARVTGRLSEKGIEALWELEPEAARYLLGSSGISGREQRRILNQLPGQALPLRTRIGGAGMLALQLAMEVAPIVESESEAAYQTNVADGMRDFRWWMDKGVIPSFVGVKNPLTSEYTRIDNPHPILPCDPSIASCLSPNDIRSADIRTVMDWYRHNELHYFAVKGIDEEEIATNFMIWATGHLITYRDWYNFLEQSNTVKADPGEFGKQQWRYRAGNVKEGRLYGFNVTETFLPSAALSLVLNTAASNVQRTSSTAIAGLAKTPGPPAGPRIQSADRYWPQDIYLGAPQAIGIKQFRSDRKDRRLFFQGPHGYGNGMLHDFPKDMRLYTFPPSLLDDVPSDFLVVGGADFQSYSLIYNNNRYTEKREFMLALEEDLEDVVQR